jgi:hypothetical protein
MHPLLLLSISTAVAALLIQSRPNHTCSSQYSQWLRFVRPFTSLLISSFLPFFVLSLVKKPCLRLRTMCEGLYVSRGPQRICVPANAAEDEILPMMSSISGEPVRAVEGAPGAASVDGVDEEDSIGRRALSRDMLRALLLLAGVVLSAWCEVVLLGDGRPEGCWRDGAQAADDVHCGWPCTGSCNEPVVGVKRSCDLVGDAAMRCQTSGEPAERFALVVPRAKKFQLPKFRALNTKTTFNSHYSRGLPTPKSTVTETVKMVPDAPPPHRLVSSTPIDVSTAASILQDYINNSEAHPHLHPDALITPTGVTFSSHGGPAGGVVMHNLRRIVAGLRGEFLEPEPTPEPEEQVAEGEETWKGKKGKGTKTTFIDENEFEWQDKEVYEQEQGEIEVGEIFDRSNVVQDGGEEPEVEVTGEKRKSKEERKKEKKERDAKRKKTIEKERQAKAQAGAEEEA